MGDILSLLHLSRAIAITGNVPFSISPDIGNDLLILQPLAVLIMRVGVSPRAC